MTTSTTPAAAAAPRRYPGQHAIELLRDPLGLFTRLARQHGDLVEFRLGPERALLVSHPDLIQEVLVTRQRSFAKGRGIERIRQVLGDGLLTSEGEHHLRQRRLAQPAFHRQRVLGYGDTMAAMAEEAAGAWRPGQRLDLHREMMALTMAIVGATLFGTDVRDRVRAVGRAMDELLELFPLALMPFSELLERLPVGPGLRLRRSRARLYAEVDSLIAGRQAAAADTGDLLSMLILARDTEGGGGGMTAGQLRDEALTILLAGHETTANLLTWALFLLAQNPAARSQLEAEVDSLGAAPLRAADAARLPFVRAALAETMRLFPPAWVIGRRATEATRVGGAAVPAGTLVFMSQYVVHRDPRFYPDPERFDPGRWAGDAQEQRPRYAYFPFGGGARVCIGEQFAWMEGALVLAALARRWRVRLAPGAAPEPWPLVTLRPRRGMPMVVEGR